jgi:dTDP-4-dehydrorhamnose 3,5-epimerase
MPIQLFKTNIYGLTLVSPYTFNDERGCIKKYFEEETFEKGNLSFRFSESIIIMSHFGVLRGLHYQMSPSQSRLVSILKGIVFAVTVDLRCDSKSFGKYETFYLSDNDNKAIYIPENFAFGALTLYEDTLLSYQCSGKYIYENNNGIVWNDKILSIPWPIDKLNGFPIIISKKDKELQSFDEFNSRLKGVNND